MEIETKSASLDTLAVTIQALHVNGKQMTLAVFRQLPIAIAYNEDGSLAPLEYWGIVRYAIKDQGDLWAVCASGGRLYRCSLEWTGESVSRTELYINNIKNEISYWHHINDYKKQNGTNTWPYNNLVIRPYGYSWHPEDIDRLGSELVEVEICLENAKRAEITLQTLKSLPQLFIAV